MDVIEKPKGWLDTLDRCRANLPGTAHPAHYENLTGTIEYFESQERKEESMREEG